MVLADLVPAALLARGVRSVPTFMLEPAQLVVGAEDPARLAAAMLAAAPAEVERHRSGKKDLTGFFVGQVMKAMQGKGNPQLVNQVLKAKLG